MKYPSVWIIPVAGAAALIWSAGAGAQAPAGSKTIAESDCTAAKLGDSIPVSAIGEPVSSVTLSEPRWNPAAKNLPGYCSVNGVMAPVDRAPNAKPINFQVAFPPTWSGRAAQLGGGGMNGTIPGLTGGPGGSPFARGFVTYGSDSGHQAGFGLGPGPGGPGGRGFGPGGAKGGPGGAKGGAGAFAKGPGAAKGPAGSAPSDDWALNDEAIKNLGYAQMKKTHDAAMVLIERMYGERPKYNYYVGSSQGGREALTVAQRYPNDYDGIAANVPIFNFSSLCWRRHSSGFRRSRRRTG